MGGTEKESKAWLTCNKYVQSRSGYGLKNIFYKIDWLSWEKQKAQSLVMGNVILSFISLEFASFISSLLGNCQREEILLCHHPGGMKFCVYKPFLRSSFLDFSYVILRSLS